MPRPRRRSKDAQDRILLRIYRVARTLAPGRTREADVEDAVHDVVVHCQAKLRSGAWAKAPRKLRAFVGKLLNNRIADERRRQGRADVADAEHLRERTPTVPDWQLPDRSWDEADIAAFVEETAKKLPYRCRKAYYMVRVEGSSYKEAAARLRLSAATIRNYIVDAHRLFRSELERVGVNAWTDHAGACSDDSESCSDDAARVPADAATRTGGQSGCSTDDARRTIRDDARSDDDAPRAIDDAGRRNPSASRTNGSVPSPIAYASRTIRDARRTSHDASLTTHNSSRPDDDAPWTQGNAPRTDRNSWRTEGAAALQVRETLSQEN